MLKNVSSGNLYSVVTMQDKEGETILHQGFNLDTLNFLRENLSDKEFVAALSIKDDTYYLSAAGGYEGDIEYAITSPDFASLSLENTIELLSNIDANSNIIDFLKTRLEKEQFVGKPLSAAINKELCSHIMASKVSTDVETKNVVFEDLNLGTIAELFEIDKEDSVIIKNLLVSKNNEGYAVIQTSSSMELLSDIFRKFDGKEDVLADILLTAIDQTSLEERYSFEECDALKAKILELATDSDLSIEKSIQLLESSGLEPQVLEYLKLQQQASNNQ